MAGLHIDSKNFDKNFKEVLENKKGQNFIYGRYDLESVRFELKSIFIIQFLFSLKSLESLTYKILFWEKEERIKSFFLSDFKNKKYEITTSYMNGQNPGILYIDDRLLDKAFLKALLDNHFNYEMAVEPSLNMRVQICINQEDFNILMDIYDDRGFDIYYLING
jgi:hypothetical protein